MLKYVYSNIGARGRFRCSTHEPRTRGFFSPHWGRCVDLASGTLHYCNFGGDARHNPCATLPAAACVGSPEQTQYCAGPFAARARRTPSVPCPVRPHICTFPAPYGDNVSCGGGLARRARVSLLCFHLRSTAAPRVSGGSRNGARNLQSKRRHVCTRSNFHTALFSVSCASAPAAHPLKRRRSSPSRWRVAAKSISALASRALV